MNELDSGRVVFFCGAGVSAGSNSRLPTFARLVDQVYSANDMEPDGVEQEALDRSEPNPDRRRPSFDKALGLLERPNRLGTRVLRRTVINTLSTPATGSLDLHRALIALSRHEQGVHLITTNFDNRFVEAGLDEQLVDAAPKLPIPKPHSWSSLVHLHGRILPDDEGSNLVLTAADFGRAYLTERWAARFVTELFREFVVVFVGYSVGDPVMSYLVDALAAERAKGAKFTMAYAFAGHDGTDSGSHKVRDGWFAKNVEPILYNDRCHHKLVDDTLVEWARIRSDPLHARSQIALNEISKLPAGPDDPMVERVSWALQDPVAAEALAEAPPIENEDDFPTVGRWVEALAEQGVLGCVAPSVNSSPGNQDPTFMPLVGYGFDPRYSQELDSTRKYLGRWIARHLHVPQLLGWVIRSGGYLHPALRAQVRSSLADASLNIPSRIRILWTVLSNQNPIDHREHLWTTDHYSTSASESESRHIESEAVKSIAPRLVACPGPSPHLLLRPLFSKKAKPIRPIDACGHLKLVSGNESFRYTLESILTNSVDLSRYADTLTNYLDQALDLIETADNEISNSSFYRPSIAEHDQNRNSENWTLLIDLARDSYFKLADAAPARGDNLLSRWVLSDQILFKRLALHALTENPKSDIQHARKLLVAGRRPGIWEWELNREVLRFFRMAGRRLPRDLRAEIVRTIHNGPITKSKKVTHAEAKSIRGEKALRFCKLMASGARLDKKSRALVEEFDYNREAGLNERNEFLVWTDNLETMSAEEYIPKELLDSSVDNVVTVLENKKIDNDGFREFALRHPVKIASALRRIANRGAWPLTFWIDFLWAIAITHENSIHYARLRNYAARVLTTAPAEVFTKVDSAATVLIKRIAGEYGIAQEQELKVIWTKAWRGIGEIRTKVQNEDDALTIALNHTSGMLAGAALIRLWKYEPPDGKGIPPPVRYYFDTISDDPSGRLGRVMLAANLSMLFAIDPEWVKKNLIPRLSLQSSEEARDLWSAHGRSHAFSHDLLLAFKSMFFEVLQDTEIDQRSKVDLVGLFMAICLERPKYLTQREIRSVVRSVPGDALPIVLDCLKSRLNGDNAERARMWRDKLSVWLQNYWPNAEGRNTSKTSSAMLEMIAKCGDAFEEAAVWSLEFLQPVANPYLYPFNKGNLAKRHPELVLNILNKIIKKGIIRDYQKGEIREILDIILGTKDSLSDDVRFKRIYKISVE